jgi:hypothetical protein
VRDGGVNVQAIPYEGRLLRCVRREQEHIAHAAILEQIARETGGNVEEERELQQAHTAADTRTLRGIPAIGRTVAGVICGTQPEQAVIARER